MHTARIQEIIGEGGKRKLRNRANRPRLAALRGLGDEDAHRLAVLRGKGDEDNHCLAALRAKKQLTKTATSSLVMEQCMTQSAQPGARAHLELMILVAFPWPRTASFAA